ncbi:MAG: PfkB family carbohydrate kinase, partial [Aeromicrobium sp.]
VDALTAHGVDARITADPVQPTATIVLTLDAAADRTMYVDRAANRMLKPADLPADIWDEVEWLHLTGYSFFDDGVRPMVIALMAEARRRQIGISVDPSSLGFLEAAGRDEFTEWVADADLLFPNDDEQGFLKLEGDVVVTLGPGGATFGEHSVAAAPTDVVDTTGAGDAFCAGFLSVWTKQGDPAKALAAGAQAAAQCVAVRGARPVRAR